MKGNFKIITWEAIVKKLLVAALVALSAAMCFAGDAAVFADIGFSEDGSTYIFGQYGKTDKKFQAWAEIYTVDVEKNVFIKNDVFTLKPGSSTVQYSGKQAYENLLTKSEWKLAKYKYKPSDPAFLLYVAQNEKKAPTEEIVFKDFDNSTQENPIFYHINLVPTISGKGKNVKSQFYIDLKKVDSSNNILLQKKVGTPDYKRDGISSYRIIKIFTDASGKNMVFVVEKTLEDETGTSIRYMVETVRL